MGRVLKAAWEGVRIAAVVFLLVCMIMGFIGGEGKFSSGVGMAYSCIAAVVIGLGFGIPSLIYDTNLPIAVKVLIHMGIGTAVMLATSFTIGWIDPKLGWLPCLLIAAGQIASAFLIWLLTCVRFRTLAKRMNERIAKKQ